MAVIIIITDENGNQVEKIDTQIKSENWEEECYQIGFKVAKQIASQYRFDLFSYRDVYTKQASMPSFYSQYASRPWVQVLKELTSLDYPPN